LASQCGLAVSRVGLGSLLGASLQETEKNIDRVFDAAAGSGVLLLFDEAEALFGKRSDVRDAHERYANVEIAYLLQRMESHAGITVLRTSGRENIEAAFLRRLRHWVVFPFPDSAAREALWRRALPDAVALADMTRLAKLQLNGGAIRTLIDRAALAATSAAEPPRLRHILATARENRMRGGAPVTAAEFGDPGEAD
jgi:SpoVK/Ycf46/Vps4 family AAA+-type ATPase